MEDNSDRRIAEKILEFTDLGCKKVLEIGCGNGRITSLLASQSDQLTAIDPDAGKIKEVRGKVSRATFLLGSGENLEFSDEHFDLVVFTLSLHHQDSDAAIGEATRVLKPEGKILVIEPVAEGEVERVFALVHDENQAKSYAQQAIVKSGLTVERSEIFHAKWIFENIEDLCRSIFAYYEMPVDPDVSEKISCLLGSKSEDRPIALSDTMVIQSIRKNA